MKQIYDRFVQLYLFLFPEKEEYPATLILTGDHDDRVSPLHSFKFTAALHHAVQKSKYQKNPLLLRVYR